MIDNNQMEQKFNGMENTFDVFAKVIDKEISSPEKKEGENVLVCSIADMLINEINDLKNSFGCPIE
jgi:hypothetical protein